MNVMLILKYLSLPSIFVVVGRIAPDAERLVLSKSVVQFSFTYGVLIFVHIAPEILLLLKILYFFNIAI